MSDRSPRRRPGRLTATLAALATVVGLTVAPAAALSRSSPARPPAPLGVVGADLSWPQCGQRADAASPFMVVGVTDGRPFTANPCLGAQWSATGGRRAAAYMNVAFPGSLGPRAGVPIACPAGNVACAAWNAGWAEGADALAVAARAGVDARMWWLDVETANTWSATPSLNAAILAGATSALELGGRQVGVYSTRWMWSTITGGWAPGLPAWLAIGDRGRDPRSHCGMGFDGGPVAMVQWVAGDRDVDLACAPALSHLDDLFGRGRRSWVSRRG